MTHEPLIRFTDNASYPIHRNLTCRRDGERLAQEFFSRFDGRAVGHARRRPGRRMRHGSSVMIVLFLSMASQVALASETLDNQRHTLRDRAVAELRQTLHEAGGWNRIHAAQALLWNGYPQGIKEIFPV
jgi:hypothetical protein